MPQYILALDEGTTNAKACLVDAAGRVVRRSCTWIASTTCSSMRCTGLSDVIGS